MARSEIGGRRVMPTPGLFARQLVPHEVWSPISQLRKPFENL